MTPLKAGSERPYLPDERLNCDRVWLSWEKRKKEKKEKVNAAVNQTEEQERNRKWIERMKYWTYHGSLDGRDVSTDNQNKSKE